MKNAHGTAGPVAVVIARVVKQGREREYEEWLAGIGEQMSAFEGSRVSSSGRSTGCSR